jgi:hypothetical protein
MKNDINDQPGPGTYDVLDAARRKNIPSSTSVFQSTTEKINYI